MGYAVRASELDTLLAADLPTDVVVAGCDPNARTGGSDLDEDALAGALLGGLDGGFLLAGGDVGEALGPDPGQ